MTDQRLRIRMMSLIVFLVVCTAGCVPESDGKHAGPDAGTEYEPPMGFEKPDRPYHDRTLIGEVGDVDTDMFNRGHAVARRGREHMAPDSNHQQFWLNQDEPFVLDLSYLLWGFDQNVDDFDIVVLANFRPIEFKMKRVTSDSGFPSVDEWQSDSGDLARAASVEIPDSTPVGVSIFIPPSSFPTEGAYDMRVLLFSRFPPSNESKEVRNGGHNLQQSVTLYYASVDFDTTGVSELEGAQLTSSSRNARLMASRVGRSTLLRPTNDIYALDEIENWVTDMKLGQVFAVEDDDHLWGETLRESFWLEEERSVIMAFDGTRPLEGTAGTISPPPAPEDVVNAGGEYVVRFPVELELGDDEVHPIRFVKMAQPFTDMLGQRDLKAEMSNTIFVRRAAD